MFSFKGKACGLNKKTASQSDAQSVKEPLFLLSESRGFGKNGEEKSEEMLKTRSIPTPHCQLFQIHGSIFKPHPVCDSGQTSMMRISHSVLLFCIGKYALYCFFSHGIYLFATFRLPKLLNQIEILLPYMRCKYLLSFFVCPAFPLEWTVLAALWIFCGMFSFRLYLSLYVSELHHAYR